MLTKVHIKNFKRFDDVCVELGQSVVLIGQNNSGKTSALQALALWEVGLRRWREKRGDQPTAKQRAGVAINRRDLFSVPVPVANLLWRDLHTRDTKVIGGRQKTKNILIEIVVEGVAEGQPWTCGLEFDYANEESFYCRPLRINGNETSPERMPIPLGAAEVKVAYLPPMSGLSDREFRKEEGEIGFLIGQGQTAQVLRNLCHRIWQAPAEENRWAELSAHVRRLFGVELLEPEYLKETSELRLRYEERGARLDISSSGRGLQQTLLLLAHLYANPGTVLLLDEPDAHLEVLRQRQTYHLLTEVAEAQRCQIVAASHSEIVLNEAAGRGVVVAFVGKPHRIDDRGNQVAKALTDIGFDQYYQAEQRGWVLYLEGSSDLAVLRAFAKSLGHPVLEHLESPFVHYVTTNKPAWARDHFYGLREAKPDLVGVALFDNLRPEQLDTKGALTETCWRKREIENYLCQREVLLDYARGDDADDLFGRADSDRRVETMEACIAELEGALTSLRQPSPWSDQIKASDEFLVPLFENYFTRLGLQVLLRKVDFHELASLVPKASLAPEVSEKLNLITQIAKSAKPRR